MCWDQYQLCGICCAKRYPLRYPQPILKKLLSQANKIESNLMTKQVNDVRTKLWKLEHPEKQLKYTNKWLSKHPHYWRNKSRERRKVYNSKQLNVIWMELTDKEKAKLWDEGKYAYNSLNGYLNILLNLSYVASLNLAAIFKIFPASVSNLSSWYICPYLLFSLRS